MPVRPGAEGQSAAAWLKDLRDYGSSRCGRTNRSRGLRRPADVTAGLLPVFICSALEVHLTMFLIHTFFFTRMYPITHLIRSTAWTTAKIRTT